LVGKIYQFSVGTAVFGCGIVSHGERL
jgi:hypothetical protein